MTIRELIFFLDDRPWLLIFYFAGTPLLSWLTGVIHGENNGRNSPWKYFYTILVYLACIPGVLSAVLTGYIIFFTRENLLDTNVLVHFIPIVSMTVSLILIRKNVSYDDVPGFDRLSGLITMIAVTFIVVLGIYKTRLWVVFGGSVFVLVAVAVGLFALLKWGAYALFRSRNEPKLKRPSFEIKR